MEVKWLNVVVLCDDYKAQVEWYKNTFDLKVLMEETGAYSYTELGHDKNHVIVGLTPAKEMEHKPSSPRNNSTFLQLKVKDMEKLYENVKANKGKIIFGIKTEEKYNFKYGSIADLEGNEIWVIEEPST